MKSIDFPTYGYSYFVHLMGRQWYVVLWWCMCAYRWLYAYVGDSILNWWVIAACYAIGDVQDKWLHYVLVDDVACLMMCMFMWLDVFMINDCIMFLVGDFGVVINTWDGCICIMMIVITDWLCNRLCILYAWWWFMMVVDIMCCCWCCMLVDVHAYTFGGS